MKRCTELMDETERGRSVRQARLRQAADTSRGASITRHRLTERRCAAHALRTIEETLRGRCEGDLR